MTVTGGRDSSATSGSAIAAPDSVGMKKGGFSLVELIVSLSIAGVLMVGMSTFFSSTFHNMFTAQSESSAAERQFAVTRIMGEKFRNIRSLVIGPPAATGHILTYNRDTGGQLPFSFMGTAEKDNKKYLAFKDMLIFSKIIKPGSDYLLGNSGAGTIVNTTNLSDVKKNVSAKNFAGFAFLNNFYYVAVPDQNKILQCPASGTCSSLGLGADIRLSMPMDVETDGTDLFFSDSGNDRIIRYTISTATAAVMDIAGLKFPTGLAYYFKSNKKYLFVADTFNNKIKKADLDSASSPLPVSTVLGDGEKTDCGTALAPVSAKGCKLSLPTGLFVSGDALYIADSGSNRVLKMSDPMPKINTASNLKLEFPLSESYVLDRVELTGDGWSGGAFSETSLTGASDNYNNKIFTSPAPLTAFSENSYKNNNTDCVSAGTTLWLNETGMSYLTDKKILVVDFADPVADKTVSVSSAATAVCTQSGGDPPVIVDSKTLTKVTLEEGLGNDIVTSGTSVFPSNPKDPAKAVVQINGVQWLNSGYLKTKIETYEKSLGSSILAETDYQTARIGDGVLGTAEDVVEIVKNTGLSFPTGVSDAYIANSMNGKIFKISDSSETAFSAVSVEGMAVFDYISDFELAAANPITFSIFNSASSPKILECVISTKINETRNQTFKIDAALLNP